MRKELCLAVAFLLSACWCAAHALPPGTILLSRNLDERENAKVPGYWNHTAIVVSEGEVVETQDGIVERGQGRGVILSRLSDYLARDYGPVLAFRPRDEQAGRRAAGRAVELVGLPPRPASSIFRRFPVRRQERGLSCVSSAVEIPWGIGGIIIPDGMMKPRNNRQFLPPVRIL